MNMEILHQEIAKVGYNAIVLEEFLDSFNWHHFQSTKDGAIDDFEKYSKDKNEASYLWMNNHYESIAAGTRAALVIARSINQDLDNLCSDVRKADKKPDVGSCGVSTNYSDLLLKKICTMPDEECKYLLSIIQFGLDRIKVEDSAEAVCLERKDKRERELV